MGLSEILSVSRALLAPVVAVLALLVAYGQYRTARHQRRIELFDRRFSIYTRTIDFVRASCRGDTVASEIAADFWAAVTEAQFLFGKDVIHALEVIKDRAIDISVSKSMISATPPEEELKYVYSMHDHQQWFSRAEEPVTKVFRHYLRLY
jgi:hypothetical protein